EDVVSRLGEREVARLAGQWLQRGVQFLEVRSGALARRSGTELAVAEVFRGAGQAWPAARRDRGWNESDAAGVLGDCVPSDARLAALAEAYEAARGGPEEARGFQRMLQAAMEGWLEGRLQAEG